MRHTLSVTLILAVACLLGGCRAADPSSRAASAPGVPSARMSPNGLEPINRGDGVIALRGYDAVAYFTEGRAAAGSAEFTHEYLGAVWRFTSAEHRDRFAKSPGAYAPQYGGYCSWAVGHGYTADGDPTAWKIVDGKLYLNYNESVKQRWEKEQDELIKQGDENFPRFLQEKPEHKG